jgi:hypothetical protein
VNSPRPTCCLIQLAITLINPSMSLIAISRSDPLPSPSPIYLPAADSAKGFTMSSKYAGVALAWDSAPRRDSPGPLR